MDISSRRLISAFIDLFISCAISVVVMIIGVVLNLDFTITHYSAHYISIHNSSLICAFAITIILMKDSINGKSVGKIVQKLQLQNAHGGIASPVQCFIRNVFLFLIPIEFVFIIFRPNRRIGDYIASTILKKEITQRGKIKYAQIIIIFIVSTATIWCLLFPHEKILNRFGQERPNFNERSYNANESIEIGSMLRNVLGQDFKVDVKVFDSMSNTGHIHISSIIQFKKYDDLDPISLNSIDSLVNYSIMNFLRKPYTLRIQNYYKKGMSFKLVDRKLINNL